MDHRRSLAKGFTWRILGTVTTIILSYIFIGKVNIALEIGFIEFFVKIF